MSVTATQTDQLIKLGPGRLVLVVGPSGAGKDTLINLARAECAGDPDIVFPRRVVTRSASAFEDNEEMSAAAFRQALDDGRFALHWEAHGHRYALPRAIDDDIGAGRAVVVNVSRGVIDALRWRYANVIVVAITAPPEILAARLAARGRSSDADLDKRLYRAVDGAALVPDVAIANVGDAREHAAVLTQIIKGERGPARARMLSGKGAQNVDRQHD
ncbi:MAG: phosphonate metabolism protein/1,5-bisphosphokinase (PRPP-forming) PhnN [Bradyrhizobium sp.]|jgi:ribose 1,5-bisphosphokinase|uniref:phosphonate metabolism protein/1,5-bisphosphokinase (PRPP-forming) PhnN n=1 Tax=Bradyrhizobium sp. TaxID=376 RepID=UPI003C7DF63A